MSTFWILFRDAAKCLITAYAYRTTICHGMYILCKESAEYH